MAVEVALAAAQAVEVAAHGKALWGLLVWAKSKMVQVYYFFRQNTLKWVKLGVVQLGG